MNLVKNLNNNNAIENNREKEKKTETQQSVKIILFILIESSTLFDKAIDTERTSPINPPNS